MGVDSEVDAREVEEVWEARPAIEGAGVHLRRAFGHGEVPRLDPFLLLDDFRSENPAEYVAGFPWHPHRGIETVTYILDGRLDHADSIGNEGSLGPGDVQWMTSGSGIIHQEMPRVGPTPRLGGFQLWVNLPASHKMVDPRYQEVPRDRIPVVEPVRGSKVRLIAGTLGGIRGPVQGIPVDPEYLDVRMESGQEFPHPIPPGRTAFAYVLQGGVTFGEEARDPVEAGHLAIFGPGEKIVARTREEAGRFLLISGRPLREPVAWWGPIVMNTRRELEQAVEEFHNGSFVKVGRPRRGPGVR
jgi:redox-sensitive bicupin YhaK (pirin superfamily)